MKLKRKWIFIFILCLFPVVCVDSCVAQKTDAHDSGHTDVLRIGMFIEPTLMHPAYTTYSRSVLITELLFCQLVRLDENVQPVPDLAERWTISDNGLVYTFTLFDDVFFHDGHPCTAYDVKFTFDAIRDPSNESPFCERYASVARINVIDRYTVQFILREPVEDFMVWLTRGILPAHCFADGILRDARFLARPIGAGPYVFGERQDDGSIILVANRRQKRHRAVRKQLFLKRLSHEKFNVVSLFRNEIDIVSYISYEQFSFFSECPDFQTYTAISDGYYALIYDLDDPFLRDRDLRYALAMAISRQSLIDDVLHGYGAVASGPFNRGTIGFTEKAAQISYDPLQAVTILEEKGFVRMRGDLYRKKNGEILELRVVSFRHLPVAETMLKHLICQFAHIGVKVSFVQVKDAGELARVLVDDDSSINAFFAFLPGGPVPGYAARFWTSNFSDAFKYSQYTGIDQSFNEVLQTTDCDVRTILYEKIYDKVVADQPALFLCAPMDFHAVSKNISGDQYLFCEGFSDMSLVNFSLTSTNNERR